MTEEIIVGLEIDRRHHRDQVTNLLWMSGGVTQAERSTLTDTEQVYFFQIVALANHVHAAVYISINVIIQRQVPVGTVGIAPIDQVDLKTCPQ